MFLKKFTIGYQNRLRDDTQTLHASCEAGELGDIYFAKAHALRRRAVPTWGVFPNKALQGGGPLIDIGTHALKGSNRDRAVRHIGGTYVNHIDLDARIRQHFLVIGVNLRALCAVFLYEGRT